MPPVSTCPLDQGSCGCCLMKKNIERMEDFFNVMIGVMTKELSKTKMTIENMTANRSAFSVALNNSSSLDCYGPFTEERIIVYQHLFINIGGGYNQQTGIFTAPRSGVYSLSVTVYTARRVTGKTCASLLVNGNVVSTVMEKNIQDPEDSSTIVATVELKAQDQVAVSLLAGRAVCDQNSHYNTFTGFLLYATD
ncbi:uncharacterized protein V6R79_021583 [Siganus canaliculatus]